MDYETAFAIAVRCNAETGRRCFIYFDPLSGCYFGTPYTGVIRIGEVGRMTPK